MTGIYQHCGDNICNVIEMSSPSAIPIVPGWESEDSERAVIAMQQGEGKRLTFRRVGKA